MHRPTAKFVFGISLIACVFGACHGGSSDYSPSAPAAPTAPFVLRPWTGALSGWTGIETVVSCSSPTWCEGRTAGVTFSNTRWRVSLSGAVIELYNLNADEGFKGPIEGRRFVARYPIAAPDFPDHAVFEGEFAEDFNSFEALSTYVVAGPPS